MVSPAGDLVCLLQLRLATLTDKSDSGFASLCLYKEWLSMPWLLGSRLTRVFKRRAGMAGRTGVRVRPSPHHHQFDNYNNQCVVRACGSDVTSACAPRKAGTQHPTTTT